MIHRINHWRIIAHAIILLLVCNAYSKQQSLEINFINSNEFVLNKSVTENSGWLSVKKGMFSLFVFQNEIKL